MSRRSSVPRLGRKSLEQTEAELRRQPEPEPPRHRCNDPENCPDSAAACQELVQLYADLA